MRICTTKGGIAALLFAILAGGLWQSAAAQTSQREKVITQLSRKLGQLKPHGTSKKDTDDFFVLGTAELTQASGHADVCFQVRQGQRDTAEFLVGYIADAPQRTLRKWHVFHRLKDDATAQQALQFTRQQYDQMQTYRDDLKRTYQATTIRRC